MEGQTEMSDSFPLMIQSCDDSVDFFWDEGISNLSQIEKEWHSLDSVVEPLKSSCPDVLKICKSSSLLTETNCDKNATLFIANERSCIWLGIENSSSVIKHCFPEVYEENLTSLFQFCNFISVQKPSSECNEIVATIRERLLREPFECLCAKHITFLRMTEWFPNHSAVVLATIFLRFIPIEKYRHALIPLNTIWTLIQGSGFRISPKGAKNTCISLHPKRNSKHGLLEFLDAATLIQISNFPLKSLQRKLSCFEWGNKRLRIYNQSETKNDVELQAEYPILLYIISGPIFVNERMIHQSEFLRFYHTQGKIPKILLPSNSQIWMIEWNPH